MQQLMNITTNVMSMSSGKGVNTSSCFNTTAKKLINLTDLIISNITSCGIDKVTTGISMMNNNLDYITNLINETTSFPTSFSKCLNSTSTQNQYTCLKNLITSLTTFVTNAPVSVTTMVNSMYEYVNLFPTSLTLCVTNVSYAATIDGVGIAMNITTCIGEKIMGLS